MTRIQLARLAAYVVVVAIGGGGLWRAEAATDDLHDLVQAEAREEEREDAQTCVPSWDVRERIRLSDEEHGEAAGEALIETVQPDNQEIVESYRRNLAARLRTASEVVPDPECDLEDAERRLAEDPVGNG